MMDYFTRLLGIQGFIVVAVTQVKHGLFSHVILDIQRIQQKFVCECGHISCEGIKYRERKIQHLSFWQHRCYLRFMQFRLRCPRCGLKVETLPFIHRYSRVSVMLGNLVYELCKVMTNKAVGIFQGLDDGTIKAIDKDKLLEKQATRSLDGITALGVDEIFVGGKNCLHMISALDGPRGVGGGRNGANYGGGGPTLN